MRHMTPGPVARVAERETMRVGAPTCISLLVTGYSRYLQMRCATGQLGVDEVNHVPYQLLSDTACDLDR